MTKTHVQERYEPFFSSHLLCQQDPCLLQDGTRNEEAHLNFSPFFLPRGLACRRCSSEDVASTSITAPLPEAPAALDAAAAHPQLYIVLCYK